MLILSILVLLSGVWFAWGCYHIRWQGLCLLLALGIGVDHLNIIFTVLVFPTTGLPYWLCVLWGAFSLYGFILLPQLNRFPFWSVLCVGGLGGSLSYLAGLKLEAVTTTFNTVSFVGVLFVEWVLLLVVASFLVARFPFVQKEVRK